MSVTKFIVDTSAMLLPDEKSGHQHLKIDDIFGHCNTSSTPMWPLILASDGKNRRTMRTTMSTFKTRQSTAGGLARASIGVRYSMGGKASIGPGSTVKTDKKKLHTNKDPRKLSEKAWVELPTSTTLFNTFELSEPLKRIFSRQRELCSEICDFLLETSYPQSLTVKDLMSISTANYFMIFSHLSGIILGPKHDPKSGAREEIMISTMKKLDYPFRPVLFLVLEWSPGSFSLSI